MQQPAELRDEVADSFLHVQRQVGFSGSFQQPRAVAAEPDFAMIYAFLGSMFDPKCGNIPHSDILGQMSAIDRRATSLIVRNMAKNLASPTTIHNLQVSCMCAASMHCLLIVRLCSRFRQEAACSHTGTVCRKALP